jgi:Zn-dependent M32 family carboxypeptidase
VSRDLHKKTESKGKADATVATADSVLPVEGVNFNGNESPNDVSSMTEEEWKPKKHRLNAKQKQEKLEAEMQAKARFSQAHKAATKLYAAELEKGEDGMSSRKVKEVIKKSTKELVQAMQQFTTMW